MSSPRRFHVPALLIAAVAALLVFAATAAAETRTGESTSSFSLSPPTPEATLVKGMATYDTTAGSMSFNITTAAPIGSEHPGSALLAGLSTSTECSSSINTLYAIVLGGGSGVTILTISGETLAPVIQGSLLLALEGGGGSLPSIGNATKTQSGTTTTLSFTGAPLVEQTYNCALIFSEGEGGETFMAFPIKAPPPPPPPPVIPPAPAAFSIAKPKAQKLKVNKWKTVHVKVTNTGATASVQGSLRVKPAKGVLVKPEVQKLPVLTPGGSFSVSVQVQLTKKAKKSSTLPVTATATGVTGTGSLVIKLTE